MLGGARLMLRPWLAWVPNPAAAATAAANSRQASTQVPLAVASLQQKQQQREHSNPTSTPSLAGAGAALAVAAAAMAAQRRAQTTSALADTGGVLVGKSCRRSQWRKRLARTMGHLAPGSRAGVRAETAAFCSSSGAEGISFEDVVNRPAPGLSAPAKISFAPDGEIVYLFAAEGGLRQQLYALDPETGAKKDVCKPPSDGSEEKDFTLEEKLRRERARELFTGITSYQWADDDNTLLVPIGKELYTQQGLGGELKKLFDPAVLGSGPILDPRISKDGSTVAFVYDSELYVVPAKGGTPVQITGGARGTPMTHGLADFIAQEEMDRYEGYWMSPDASMVAFEEVDESHIPVYRIMHQGSDEVGAGAQEDHHYPFAGAKNGKVRLGVTPCSGEGKVVWFDIESVFGDDFYLARVNWLPDGKAIVAQVENREQTKLELVRLSLETGKAEKILREETDVWINLHNMFRPLKKSSQFIWASERSGFMHLYLYDTDGKQVRQLTDGNWLVEDIKAVDEDAGLIYFVGNKDDWMDRHLYSVPIAGGEPKKLTTVSGLHNVVVNTKLGRFVDVHHSSKHPLQVELRKLADGSLMHEIYKNEDPKIEKLGLKAPEFFTLPSTDGKVELQAAVWKPDPAKFGPGPYPTCVSVYGGPHVQKISNSWGTCADMRANYLVSKGYLVLSVDNRGSARRGLHFEGAIKHDMGNLEVVDQVTGVKKCVEMGLTDPKRVAMYGWSYGGYMSAMSLAKEPEVFQAAISGAPVTHWDGYDTHYTERYMGTPQSNPEGYKVSAVMEHIDKMRGKLLLVHGLLDENVHFRHTARLINTLVRQRKPYELLLFPDERHTPRGVKDRVYMEEQMFEFLEKSIKK